MNMSKPTTSQLAGGRVSAAIVLALFLGVFYAGAMSSVTAQTAVKAKVTEKNTGPKEGIKVHGHWTIDVRNPDGTLVTHREFENALEATNPLAEILGRQKTVGEWQILFQSLQSSGSPCLNNEGVPILCAIVESSAVTNNLPFFFKTLTVAATAEPGNRFSLTLSGNATAGKAGEIGLVRTRVSTCSPSVPASNCIGPLGTSIGPMTSTNIQPVVTVVQGQIIQVTVVISFS
jgi:hypothetical protein